VQVHFRVHRARRKLFYFSFQSIDVTHLEPLVSLPFAGRTASLASARRASL
jgi:hypothetical protein